MIHIALGTPDCYEHLPRIMGSAEAEKDEYASNIQVAELNALAAILSVIRWKKHLGYYADIIHEPYSVYTLNSNEIDREEETV